MKCNVCSTISELTFSKKVLYKYDVGYYLCPKCHFLQTEKPYWIDEAYSSAIADLDTGILVRNLLNIKVVQKIITSFLNPKKTFLDFAGGHGTFTRLMRDIGFDYYSHDKYCENAYSSFFNKNNLKNEKFELITAFELFEHIEDPISQLKELFLHTDNIFISTSIHPNKKTELEKWNYLVPETGQHISFYSEKSLQYIAKELEVNLVSNGSNYHLLSKRKKNTLLFRLICSNKTNRLIPLLNKPKSLTLTDFENIKLQSEK